MSARKLVVTWPNPTHPLLGTFSLVVKEGANQLSPSSSFPGNATTQARFEFDVQSSSSKVGLNLTFTSSIGGGTSQVLNANQVLTPSGADLSPQAYVIDPSGANRLARGTHPLILTGSDPASGSLAVTVIQVNTQFVNVTGIWNKTAKGDFLNAYNTLHLPDVSMVVLGYTGGAPLIWIATVPKACVDVTEVSAIVFFRPTLSYQYTTLDDPNHKGNGMSALCRYLLAPDLRAANIMPIALAPDLALDLFGENTKGKLNFVFVCASFERALSRLGKPVVLLTPLPQSGTEFNDAKTSMLYLGKVTPWPNVGTPLADSAVALLRAEDKILRPEGTFKFKRRGLMGYSAGGAGFWSAFSANKKKVDEVYSFDTQETPGKAPELAQWARATAGFRLRLVGSFQFNENNNIKQTVDHALTAPGAATGEISTHPSSEKFWLPTAAAGSKWWEYVMSKAPNFRKHNDLVALGKEGDQKFIKSVKNIRHQFVIFGGEVFDPAKDATRFCHPGPNTQTWLEMFLRKSGF